MEEGLTGIKVLELADGVAAAVAGKLIADLGAEVVKVEPPGGEPGRFRGPFRDGVPDPEASGLYLALNPNKRSLELELEQPAGQAELERLAARAHLLIHDFPPGEMERRGLDHARLARRNPGLVMLSITPFGLTGPYRDYAAADLTLFHASGWGFNCPGPGGDPEQPPIKPFGRHADIQAGLHGATAALGTLRAVRRGAPGVHLDLSVQEAAVTCLGRHLVNYSYTGWIDSRLREAAYAPNGFFPCKDGGIYLVTIEEDQWQRLMELLGDPEWAQAEAYRDKWIRAKVEDELNERLSGYFREWRAEDLYRACQERRICAARVHSYDELEADEHLRARGFIHTLEHPVAGKLTLPGAPYALKRPWWGLRSPAPLLGEANGETDSLLRNGREPPAGGKPGTDVGEGTPAAARPLEGVRVLDFTWVWAGPHCSLMLALLGAEVLKIESPNRPDLLRRTSIIPEGMEPGLNRSGTFNQMGQGKKSLSINLSHPGGLELVKELARHCDVVTSNFSTGVMERFGLGAEELHRINPDLIVAAISGFGQTGPRKDYMGYGQAIVPLAGISAQTGYPGGGPAEVATAYGDPNAGVVAAFGIVAALVARDRHGGGQFLDVSLWEAMAASGFEGWINHSLGNPPHAPMGNHDPVWAPHNCYRCSGEDRWVAIAVTDEGQWRRLCGAMGQEALAEDPRFRDAAARKANEDALDEILSVWCAGQDRWEVTGRLQGAGVPAFPSLDTKDVAEDPHLNARGYFGRAPHPEVGVRTHAGKPWRAVGAENGGAAPAPLLGQHTDEVLREVLELSDGEITRLREEGVLG
jgi:crotonobetainyl-CoA:carnitine CoA-transferase CaiB-like acyl-CoA transferase